MTKDERYDVVIVGGGHNGMTTAAYLSKCGLSVCVLEERTECGGPCETVEPLAGVRIYPHAMLMYGAPAPGFEQLELWKYGFRMSWNPMDLIQSMGGVGQLTSAGLEPAVPKDMEGFAKLSGLLSATPFIKDLLRATFWCPPHPPEVEVTDENVPYMQVYKQHQPDVWTSELREWTMFDMMDEHMETESLKTVLAFAAWASGAAAHWEGVGVPSFLSVILIMIAGKLSIPRGGLHGYFHAVHRCAVSHGTVVRTCCPVDEILIEDGRAVGVRLRENAAWGPKRIWANKAVIANTDYKQTFLQLVGRQHLDASFLQRIKDISLKGGSLYVSTLHTREPLRWRSKFKAMEGLTPGNPKVGVGAVYPADSRAIYYENVADADGHKGMPKVPPERLMWFLTPPQAFDPSDCQGYHPKGHISAAFEVNVPAPEYHVDGPDAIDKVKDQMNAYMRKAFSQVFEGADGDNVLHHWAATPYEAEFRHSGLVGGTWCGTRHCRDQLWTQRPLPELARYRTPIDGLYHAHQTSGHPGALCLMAIPYNLMHILIEDGIAEPGNWWYPSPWYIPQEGKISADPAKRAGGGR